MSFMKCYVVSWPSLKKLLLHPIDLRNQSRTLDFVFGNIVSLGQVGFNCTHQQLKQWSPLNYGPGQGMTKKMGSCFLGGCAPSHRGQLYIQPYNQAWECRNMDGVWPATTKLLWMFKLSEQSSLPDYSSFWCCWHSQFQSKFCKFLALRLADKTFRMSL